MGKAKHMAEPLFFLKKKKKKKKNQTN